MNQNYGSRKRKIYNDYSSVPYERLIEMVKNKNDFSRDVIEVIKDILRERGASIPAEENQAYVYSPPASSSFQDNSYNQEFHNDGKGAFVEKFREKDNEEIISTITRYSEFLPEAVDAALTVAVDKGLISFDLRNALSEQITSNTSTHWKRFRTFEWEKNNAFVEFVKGYSDDEIFNILEDPSGIVIDVYHAVLVTAVSRELITNEEFNNYYAGAKKALKDDQIENESFNDIIRETPVVSLPEDDTDPEAEKENYWKCPRCGESVLMDLNVCWNCEATMPINIVHPSTEEITRELIKDSKPGITPYLLIGLAFVIIIGGVILRGSIRGRDPAESLLIFLVIMVVVILYNVIFKKKRK